MRQEIVPFARYVRLYTLHQIEGPADLFLLRIRIETLHYSFAPITRSGDLDAAYADDPRAGAEQVQQAVLPRLQTLLDTRDPFQLLGTGPETVWPQYAVTRGLPAQPTPVPAIHAPTSIARLPVRSRTSERLVQAQRALEAVQTTVETAAALAALWQNWQIGREQRRLIETQRVLLHNAIQAQLDGQGHALDHALSRDFVRGYLSDHGEDSAYDVLFQE